MEYIQLLNICIKITEKKGRDLKHEKVSAARGSPLVCQGTRADSRACEEQVTTSA